MSDFTTIKRPTLQEFKEKYKHVQGKTFYRTASEECPIHVILADLADLGSRGATINKIEKGEWSNGPEWLLNEKDWPERQNFERTKGVIDEHKPIPERVFKTVEKAPDEWEALLTRSKCWKTLRVTVWDLRFVNNALAKKNGTNKERAIDNRRDCHHKEPLGKKRTS